MLGSQGVLIVYPWPSARRTSVVRTFTFYETNFGVVLALTSSSVFKTKQSTGTGAIIPQNRNGK